MKSQIEKLIERIEEYVENCRPQPFSNNKIIVDRAEISEMLMDLRSQIPKEIEQYQKVISSQDSIMKNANDRAERIIKQAEVKRQSLIDEDEIKQEAQKEADRIMDEVSEQANQLIDDVNIQAQEIVNNAYDEADAIHNNAVQYMNDVMEGMQELVTSTLNATQRQFDLYVQQMQTIQSQIIQNREEVNSELTDEEEVEGEIEEEEEYSEKYENQEE